MKEISLIYQKMIAITKDIDAIDKTQKNSYQGYNFRGIDDIYNNLHTLFGRHGVFCTPVVKDCKSEILTSAKGQQQIRVSAIFDFVFYAEDGSSVTCTIPAEGIDTSDKATNKSISAAMKYALITVFSIPTKDIDDGDRESPEIGHEYIDPRRIDEMEKLLSECENIEELKEMFFKFNNELKYKPVIYQQRLINAKDKVKEKFV